MKTKKIIAFLMSVILAALTFCPAFAVTYPEGVTETQCISAISKLDIIISKLEANGTLPDFKKTVYDTLTSDETLGTIFSSVYTELADSASTLGAIGVNLSPANLANCLKAYPAVSKAISSSADLLSAAENVKGKAWNVSDKEGFISALAAIFAPFNQLLKVVLCSSSLTIAKVGIVPIKLTGADGYTNSIVPLLNILGAPNIMTQDAFNADADANMNSMLKNIAKMALDALDKILEAPVDGICSVLPAVVKFINDGKLTELIKGLVAPLRINILLINFSGLESLLGDFEGLGDSIDFSALLANADLSQLSDGGIKLTLAEMDFDALAACASESGGTYTVNKADAFITLLGWIIKTLKLNSSAISSAVGDTTGTVAKLLEKDDAELIKTLFTLLYPTQGATAISCDWSFPDITPAEFTYTGTYGRDDYMNVVNKIDATITEALADSDPDASIDKLAAETIYSSKTLAAITTALYGAVGGKDTAQLFSMLGISVSPYGVSLSLSAYPAAARVLRNSYTWENVNPDYLSFGFENGDRDGFYNALTAVLKPMAPLFRFLLAGGSISLLEGLVTLYGGDGYNAVVIPVLEALGCPSETIVDYATYKARSDTDAVITDILTPVFALLDNIIPTPIASLVSILPNVVYFIENGGLKTAVEGLISPVTASLSSLGLSDLVDMSELTASLDSLDIGELVNSLTSELPIKLPEPDFSVLASLGTPTVNPSRRTVNGQYAQYTYITADTPAVVVTVLRYVVKALKMEENANVLTDLMAGSSEGDDGTADMFSMYAGNIGGKFETMTVDEIVEFLYEIFIRETPPVEITTVPDIEPIIYQEKQGNSSIVRILLIVFAVLLIAGLVVVTRTGIFDKISTERKRKKIKKENAKKEKAEAEERAQKQKAEALKKQTGQRQNALRQAAANGGRSTASAAHAPAQGTYSPAGNSAHRPVAPGPAAGTVRNTQNVRESGSNPPAAKRTAVPGTAGIPREKLDGAKPVSLGQISGATVNNTATPAVSPAAVPAQEAKTAAAKTAVKPENPGTAYTDPLSNHPEENEKPEQASERGKGKSNIEPSVGALSASLPYGARQFTNDKQAAKQAKKREKYYEAAARKQNKNKANGGK